MTPRVSEAAIIRAAERGARTPGRAWQHGACLRYGEGRARVWMDVNEDKVSVTVVGPAEEREELLGMIRATLRRMRAYYRRPADG